MPGLSVYSTASIRTQAKKFQTTSCQVLVRNLGDEVGGSAPATWSPLADGPYGCIISQRRQIPKVVEEGGTNTPEDRFLIKFADPIDLPITIIPLQYRVQVVGGATYEVLGSNRDQTDAIQVVLECTLLVS